MSETPEPWQHSAAKENLALEILAGLITETTDLDILHGSLDMYRQYDRKKFKRNIKALMKSLAMKEARAAFDTAAVINARNLYPRPALTSGGYPFWDTSVAKVSLSSDVDNGIDQNMTSAELWNSRQEYKLFPIAVFQKHILQEHSKRKASGFFLAKLNKK